MDANAGRIWGGFCEEQNLVSTDFGGLQAKIIILKDSGG